MDDLIYPPPAVCPLCGRQCPELQEEILCPRCQEAIPFIQPPVCLRCGRPLRLAAANPCHECAGRPLFYQSARAVGLYKDYFRQIILALKYFGRLELAEPLGGLLAARFEDEPELCRTQAIVPVPLHLHRLARRGFNQAELLARAMAKTVRRPVFSDTLERIKATKAQNQLTLEERRSNVAGAFVAANTGQIRGRRVLLVDDIMTTGFTVSECARVLLAAGATEVHVLTLAVGVVEEQWLAGILPMDN
ncbi:MAG TPA: ComF family protein [Bacillota bacterium]|nr:ComF family protein [Bacillota bacterium]